MLAKLVGSRTRAGVLGWLLTHADERYFVRQLESLIGEDSTNLSRELSRLADLGILECEVEGRQKYYRANTSCPIFEELRSLAAKTYGLADILRDSLKKLGESILMAFVYGSQADGTATATSDVDLMIIGDVRFADVVAALSEAHDRIGREINPTVYPPDELKKKLVDGNRFVQTVLKGPKIFLKGNDSELAKLAD